MFGFSDRIESDPKGQSAQCGLVTRVVTWTQALDAREALRSDLQRRVNVLKIGCAYFISIKKPREGQSGEL